MFVITKEWLDKYKTIRGGYAVIQIKAIGEPWPPVSGWKKRAVGRTLSESQRLVFETGAVSRNAAKKKGLELLGLTSRTPKKKRKREKFQAHAETRLSPPPAIYVEGVDVTSTEFLRTYAWTKLRMVALKKNGAVCQCCGASPATGAVMNVDHIKPRKLYPELALVLSNTQTLCDLCNKGKANWDMTDWRDVHTPSDDLDDDQRAHIRSILKG